MWHHHGHHITQMTLSLASHDANGVTNCPFAFLRSRWLKLGTTWHFWSWDTNGAFVGIMTLMESSLASDDASGIINGTTEFLRSRQSICGTTWLFWSFDTIGTIMSITWYQWHCYWYLKMSTESPRAQMHSLGQDNFNDV